MSNNKQIQLLDGYWVIGTNKWDAKIYTEEEAVKYADTLINCHNCSDCSDCSDFKENPERITSPLLGSRNSQTTFYWNDKKEQIVCGCFQGNLEEFEMKIKEMHGENKYAQGYLKWIEKIKIYRQ